MAVLSTDRVDEVIDGALKEIRARGWRATARIAHGGMVVVVMESDYEEVRAFLESRPEYARHLVPRTHPFAWDWINRPR